MFFGRNEKYHGWIISRQLKTDGNGQTKEINYVAMKRGFASIESKSRLLLKAKVRRFNHRFSQSVSSSINFG